MGESRRSAFLRLNHPQTFGERVLQRYLHTGQFIAALCPHPRQYRSCGRGFGKSTGLIIDPVTRRATLLPYVRAEKMKLDRPVSYKALLVASTKEQAFELQVGIRQQFESNDVLANELSPQTTKTNLVLNSGARIMVRPATAGARGIHPETKFVKGQDVYGTMDVYLDEFAYFGADDFYRAVIKPMMSVADPYSSLIAMNSTPRGQIGETYQLLTDEGTGACLQKIEFDKSTGMPDVKFNRDLCELCMRTRRVVKFQFPSWWNPHMNMAELYREKEELFRVGRADIWYQEREGIPMSTSGLFFNEKHNALIWDDHLPQYLLTDDGEFIELGMRENEDGEPAQFERYSGIEELTRGRGRRFILSIDPNYGSGSKRADYAAISLIEVCQESRRFGVKLRLCQRYKRPPRSFMGRTYSDRELTVFLLDYAMFLIDMLDIREVYVDEGGGGPAYLVPLRQRYGEERILGVPTSHKAKVESLVHVRTLIERGMFRSPEIRFLMDEMQFLLVDQDSLERHDKMMIEKAASHGTAGAEVDGWFAIAYACRGTMNLIDQLELTIVEAIDSRRLPESNVIETVTLSEMQRLLDS